MSMNANQIPVYFTKPISAVANLNAASAGALGADTNAVTVYTAPADAAPVLGGAIINSLIASSTDTAAVNLFIQKKTAGGTVIPIGQVNVPINSGNIASTPMVDCLDPTVCKGLPYDNAGKPYIQLQSGELLIVSAVANMTAAKNCYVAAQILISE